MFEAVGAIIAAVLKVGVPIFFAAFVATAIALFLPDLLPKSLGSLISDKHTRHTLVAH